ncbi:ATP-binding cassette domain-containing protein [Gilvimarinus xylanilyticus]|uniref:ATP-binding cassette domain-containing protein n=1 Tax=Gilvimarinus xylanilyticus TaxID=2944139 RepID=A0A9X2KTG4_9GAMM|nr:ATP-binding cassette domain-containing protein [Gilvimarinus xylanilyticus]MCP8899219.1 ATP-binding cassette domain-containing protein [Gilvimarinus xylanilyticus]
MIEINNVSKTFGSLRALDNLSACVGEGEIVGLLGLNGAGKSTLMRMIYGLVEPTAGDIVINGTSVVEHPEKARSLLGVLPDNAGLYKRLSARENIEYFGRLQGLSETELAESCDELIDILGMNSIAGRYADGFSLGERMKTVLARAIVHRPKYILLDEPTNGLDVITTRAVRTLLREQKAAGRSVLFSSHLMYEVENLCDRVLIIAGGKLVAEGRVEQVVQQAQTQSLEEAFVRLSEATHVA